jgi:hypothetical protein
MDPRRSIFRAEALRRRAEGRAEIAAPPALPAGRIRLLWILLAVVGAGFALVVRSLLATLGAP